LVSAAVAAGAPTARELRAAGRACEQPDGFLRALSPDAQADVERLNGQRRAVYQRRAAELNVDVAASGVIFAEQIRGEPDYRPCP
jgi:uncharacterized protein YdbL (DUF1318 family)